MRDSETKICSKCQEVICDSCKFDGSNLCSKCDATVCSNCLGMNKVYKKMNGKWI
jgi:hypothetical protein